MAGRGLIAAKRSDGDKSKSSPSTCDWRDVYSIVHLGKVEGYVMTERLFSESSLSNPRQLRAS
jgi:hypothetical protein